MKLDKATLDALAREAARREKAADKVFQKFDDAEHMHVANGWGRTAEWLRGLADSADPSP